MNKMHFIISLCLWVGLAFAESHDSSNSVQSEAPKKHLAIQSVPYSTIRLNGYDFEYLSQDNVWLKVDEVNLGEEPKEIKNQNGTVVESKRTDITFRVGENWYKGKQPELLVPNPEKVPLTMFNTYVIHFTNLYRKSKGLKVLPVSKLMTEVAEEQGLWMASGNGMKHITTRGNYGSLLKGMGILENIAYGQKSPQSVVQTWINSSGHRKNIESTNTFSISAASYRNESTGQVYWVQQFQWK